MFHVNHSSISSFSLFFFTGGVMRKIFYAATAMTATTSLCYPKETVALTTNTYNNTMDSVKTWWAGVGK